MRVILATVIVLVAFSATGVLFAAEDAPLPPEYLAEQEYFSGHCVGKGNNGDDATKVEYRARWSPGKHCLVFQGTTRRTAKSANPVHWTLVSGWDGQRKQIVDGFFASDGSSSMTCWTITSATEQQGKEIGFDDGRKFTAEPKVVKHGPDAWTFTSTAAADGKPVKIEYRKVKEEKK